MRWRSAANRTCDLSPASLTSGLLSHHTTRRTPPCRKNNNATTRTTAPHHERQHHARWRATSCHKNKWLFYDDALYKSTLSIYLCNNCLTKGNRMQLVLLSLFQASLITRCVEAKMMTLNFEVFLNFVGASPASSNIVAVLRRFCFELTTRFELPAIGVIDEYL